MDFLQRAALKAPVLEKNSLTIVPDQHLIDVLNQSVQTGLLNLSNSWLESYPTSEFDTTVLRTILPDNSSGFSVNNITNVSFPSLSIFKSLSLKLAALSQVLYEMKGKDISNLSDKILMARLTSVLQSAKSATIDKEFQSTLFSSLIQDVLGTSDNPKSQKDEDTDTEGYRSTSGLFLNRKTDIEAWNSFDILAYVGVGSLHKWEAINKFMMSSQDNMSVVGLSYKELLLITKFMQSPFEMKNPELTLDIFSSSVSNSNLFTLTEGDKVQSTRFSILFFFSLYDSLIKNQWSRLRQHRDTRVMTMFADRMLTVAYMINTYLNSIVYADEVFKAARYIRAFELFNFKNSFSTQEMGYMEDMKKSLNLVSQSALFVDLPSTIMTMVKSLTPTDVLLESELPTLLLMKKSEADIPSMIQSLVNLHTKKVNNEMNMDNSGEMDFIEKKDYVSKTLRYTDMSKIAASIAQQWYITSKRLVSIADDLRFQENFFDDNNITRDKLQFSLDINKPKQFDRPRVYYNSLKQKSWFATGLTRYDKEGKLTYNKAGAMPRNMDLLIHQSTNGTKTLPGLFPVNEAMLPSQFIPTYLPYDRLTGEAAARIDMGAFHELSLSVSPDRDIDTDPIKRFDIAISTLQSSKLRNLFYGLAGNYIPVLTSIDALFDLYIQNHKDDVVKPMFGRLISSDIGDLTESIALRVDVFSTELDGNTSKFKLKHHPEYSGALHHPGTDIQADAQIAGSDASTLIDKKSLLPLHLLNLLKVQDQDLYHESTGDVSTYRTKKVPRMLYVITPETKLPIWGLPAFCQHSINMQILANVTWDQMLQRSMISVAHTSSILLPITHIPSKYAFAVYALNQTSLDKKEVDNVPITFANLNTLIWRVSRTKILLVPAMYSLKTKNNSGQVVPLTIDHYPHFKTLNLASEFVDKITWSSIRYDYAHLLFTYKQRATFDHFHTLMGTSRGGVEFVFFKKSTFIQLKREEVLNGDVQSVHYGLPQFTMKLKMLLNELSLQTQTDMSSFDQLTAEFSKNVNVETVLHENAVKEPDAFAPLPNVNDVVDKINQADAALESNNIIETKPVDTTLNTK